MEASTDDDFGGGRNYQHQHPKIDDDDDKPIECQGIRGAYKPNTEDLSQKPPRHEEGGTQPHHIQTE